MYDTEKTKQTVNTVINWYKKYRDILNSDIVHLRRADGRDWDGWMHVNPQLKTKALIMLFNPMKETITRTVKIPLYYTGIATAAALKEKGATIKNYTLNRNYEVELAFTIAPESYTWYTVE